MDQKDIETLIRIEDKIDVILAALQEELSRVNAAIAKIEAEQEESK
jgi:hypothetical protein